MDTIQELAEEILNVLDMKRKGRVDAFPELSANEYLEHQLQAVRDAERERCASQERYRISQFLSWVANRLFHVGGKEYPTNVLDRISITLSQNSPRVIESQDGWRWDGLEQEAVMWAWEQDDAIKAAAIREGDE